MNQNEFRRHLAAVTPEVPSHFSRHVDCVLESLVQTENRKPHFANKRIARSVMIFASIAVLLCSAAFAAAHWGIFDALSFMLGNQPLDIHAQMQKILHKEIINDVEITIHETIYDGRTLFVQYSYCMLDEAEPFGLVDENGNLQSGITLDAMKKLQAHNVGWWIDNLWINGQSIDMAQGSGTEITGSLNPGEIIVTEYWRLDQLGISLNGNVNIALPIGEMQPLSDYYLTDHPEKYDAEGNLLQPEKGLVAFTFDAAKATEQVATLHPNIEVVLPDLTVQATEAAFSPLMTYITLELEGNPDALAAYKAKYGEGEYNENGKLLWAYSSQDVHTNFIRSLELVDSNGRRLFPDRTGCSGVGDDWAEFLYPYIAPEDMPDELWLAPVNLGVTDMSQAIRVK